MPRRERANGALYWIGIGVAIAVLLLLFAAMQWNYLPRNWRGFAWLAFVGVPVWLLLEWVGERVSNAEKGKGWRWRAIAYPVLLAALVVVVWLMFTVAPPPR